MKTSRFIAATLLALTFACLASAQTTIRVSGSSAFRKAFYASVVNAMGATATAAFYNGNDTAVTDMGSAGRAVFSGTIAGNPTVIQCCWAGSVGGVQALVNNLNVTTSLPTSSTTGTAAQAWLSATANTLSAVTVNGSYVFSGGTQLLSTSNSGSGPQYNAANTPTVAMSDSFQVSTLYTSPTVTSTKVGVVPFVWVKGQHADIATTNSAYSRFTNMTPTAARSLLANGYVPMSLVTGSSSDQALEVVVSGRDNDSGTRLAAFAESGYGVFINPVHVQLNNNGTNITSLGFFTGAGGYSSGGTMATALSKPVATGVVAQAFPSSTPTSGTASPINGDTAHAFIPVAYFGTSDASTVKTALGSQSELTYNGVAYSAAAVREGQYTFWTYEHLMYRPSATTTEKAIADAIANQIISTDAAAAGIVLSTMKVTRSIEGGVISTLLY